MAFISFTETLDFSTPQGRAMAGMIGVFANFERDVLKERVKAGIADAKRRGVQFGRPSTINEVTKLEMKALSENGKTHLEIAKMFGIGRTTVLRILGPSLTKRGRRPKQKSDSQPQLIVTAFLKQFIANSISKFSRIIENSSSCAFDCPIESLPAVIPERVHYAEVTDDNPKSLWEIELEEKKI